MPSDVFNPKTAASRSGWHRLATGISDDYVRVSVGFGHINFDRGVTAARLFVRAAT
jgi:hypothetical protein